MRDGQIEEVGGPLHESREVACRDHSDEGVVVVDDGDGAAHPGERDDDVADGGAGGRRRVVLGHHDVPHQECQAPPQRAARVDSGEVVGAEAAVFHEGHRKGVSHGQGGGGRGGGREVQRTGFGRDAAVEDRRGGARER